MTMFNICGMQLDLPASGGIGALELETRKTTAKVPWLDMVVFGELAVNGPDIRCAEPTGGPTELRLQRLAAESGVWLVPGSFYEIADDLVYNTSIVIDPSGSVVARYRKLFPWAPWEGAVSRGTEPVVWDIPGVGRFGLSVCYDSWFPETTRALAWMGAEVIIHPTATDTVDRNIELVLAQAHAASNQCSWIEVNSAAPLAVGRSIVVGPEGDVVHQAGHGREIITTQVDLERIRRVRDQGSFGFNQVLKNLRDFNLGLPQYGGRPMAPSEAWSQMGEAHAIASESESESESQSAEQAASAY